MPDSRKYRRSRRYDDDYSDSDDEYYYSDDGRRPRARSLERDRDDRRRRSQRHRSPDDHYDHYDRRRPRSTDRHPSSRHNRPRSRDRDRDYDRDRSRRSESMPGDKNLKIQHAINAGLKAGALEAFRVRKEPGPWVGSKGVRIATAAFGAAMAGGALQQNTDPERNRKKNSAKATLSGLLLNRVLNGPRDDLRRR